MAKQAQGTQVQGAKQSRHQVEPTDLESQTAIADQAQVGWSFAAAGAGSVEVQAARLGDGRLQSAQRHALAGHIGRVRGNRHLQKVMASLGGDAGPQDFAEDLEANRVSGQPTAAAVEPALSGEARRVMKTGGHGVPLPNAQPNPRPTEVNAARIGATIHHLQCRRADPMVADQPRPRDGATVPPASPTGMPKTNGTATMSRNQPAVSASSAGPRPPAPRWRGSRRAGAGLER
jgi:hypothetical protein